MAASNSHQQYYDYSFSTGFCSFPTVASREETSNMLYNNDNVAAARNMVPWTDYYYEINSPVSSVASFHEQFGISDCTAVPQLPEFEMGFRDLAAADYDYQENQVFEPGEICSRLVTNVSPAYTMPADNWGIKGEQVVKLDESEVKVGRYTAEERKERILRYLKKRNQRNFNKTIKYACRKTLADKRVRVRGRFAKNQEPCEDDVVMKTITDNSYQQSINPFYEDSFQMKYHEDDWLQAAMANLLPYLSS